MAKVDLTLIRLALYEIKFENIPVGVAINEAVTLADEFGTDNSAGFVNGALAKLV
jgi:N utilization substance protein B